MEISILFVIVVIILAGCILHGYVKGLIRVVFSLVSIFLTIGLVMWMTPYVSTFLETQTSIYQNIQEKCIESLQMRTEKEVQQQVEEQESIQIAGVELPEKWQEMLSQKTTETADDFLEQSGVYEEIGAYVAGVLVNIIACIITFVVVVLILRILVNLLDIVAKLPVLNSMNHLGGTIAGAAEGVIIVWILFFVITLCQASELGQGLMKDINDNPFLKILYENNIVAYILMRVIL